MVRVRFPYRNTEMGGLDLVFVFSNDGMLIQPIQKRRSKSGRHGDDVYELSNGVYYVAWFTRPNNPGKPITVRFIRLVVIDGGYTEEYINEDEPPQPILLRVRAIYNKLAGGEVP